MGPLLLIDDDEIALRLFAAALQTHEIECITATSGAEGLHAAAVNEISAVVCDLHLATTSGIEFLRTLRQTEAGRLTPVAIVTRDLFAGQDVGNAVARLMGIFYQGVLFESDLMELVRRLTTVTMNPAPRCVTPRQSTTCAPSSEDRLWREPISDFDFLKRTAGYTDW